MSKPINSLDFWKKRLDEALTKCKDIRYTVYFTSQDDWSRLNEVHQGIISKEIPAGSKVLDAGCGYGRLAPLFENYTGADFSPDLIAKAKELFPEKEFVQTDFSQKSPFKRWQFDWAVAVSFKAMIIENMGEEAWTPIQRELKRVAKKVLLLEYSNPENHEVI